MKLKVLSSGSQGNCYVIDGENECLLLDLGVPLHAVKVAVNFNVLKISGAVVTHEHKDHAGYVGQFAEAGIKIFKPFSDYSDRALLGAFSVKPFPLVHDVPCYGFLIEHPAIGRLLYITDTEYVKYKFKDIDWIMVEANYAKELLDESLDGSLKRSHVLRGHMDIDTTCRFIQANDSDRLKGVILLHMSDSQGDKQLFIGKAKNATEKPIWVAEKGLEVELNG